MEDSSEKPTGIAPQVRRAPTPSPGAASPGAGRISTSAVGRFAPGQVLAERYRIVGLLGRGGMGEVYRADDLKLGQPVALKFLPESVQHDPEWLARFYNEARMARQVTHPAVCRVHDVGDVDGLIFLSMEYVDGEDLATLLKRIGRLPPAKAAEIARQVSAGLAAAHAKGVLHRDLKPANIMLDGEGRARVTDFGLAGLAESLRGAEVRSGTPAYMSPEQLAGREVTARSDVYSLGLVLYELLTGRRAFEGTTLAELMRQRENPPPRPSELVPEVDPRLEKMIVQCLEKDPPRRPSSALSVAAGLPGGDPLAALLASGETPSPEMVAAAGEAEERISPRLAWASVGALAAVLVLAPILSGPAQLLGVLPEMKPPEVLEDRAREIIDQLGYPKTAVDQAVGYAVDSEYFSYVRANDASAHRWEGLRTGVPPVLHFYYRTSPRPLESDSLSGQVFWNNPPLRVSGMTSTRLDVRGRLVAFFAVPPQVDAGARPATEARWETLLDWAGFDPGALKPTASQWTPPFHADTRVAWEGSYPERPDIPIRVEAAAHRGRPVAFYVVAPWTRAERDEAYRLSTSLRASNLILGLLFVGLLAAAVLLARHHMRSGRGDRRGSFRVALAAFILAMTSWALRAHHLSTFEGELGLAVFGLAGALLTATVIWIFYVALEPLVRRLWPHALISWTRLLATGPRDPLVGRDLLVGVAAGSLVALLLFVALRLPVWLGSAAFEPVYSPQGLDTLLSLKYILAAIVEQPIASSALATGSFLALALLRMILRRERVAAAVLVAVLGAFQALRWDLPLALGAPMAFLVMGLFIALALRYGLLAYVIGACVANLLLGLPMTGDFWGWAGEPMRVGYVAVLALAAWGFRTARAGLAAERL